MYYHLYHTTSGGINTFKSVSYLFFVFLEEGQLTVYHICIHNANYTAYHRAHTCEVYMEWRKNENALLQFCGNKAFQDPFCSSSLPIQTFIPIPTISVAL